MSIRLRGILAAGSMALAMTLGIAGEGAVARTFTIQGKSYSLPNNFNTTAGARPFLSNRGASIYGHPRAPTWANVNKQSPIAVRNFLTPYQPNSYSAGGYFPWMTQRPYGMPMRGTPAARAVCATTPGCSDVRLKTDIAPLGRLANGLGLYRFRYIGDDRVFVGVMAQEVAAIRADAVMRGADGYLRVNYARLGLRMQTWDEWSATTGE